MDKYQATFEILYILSSIKNDDTTRELAVIEDFLINIIGKITFDTDVIINKLFLFATKDMIDEFAYAASVVKQKGDSKDRNNILDFSLRLMAENDVISNDNVKSLFVMLGNIWDININKFRKEKI